MAQENIRAEFGAWIAGDVAKKSNPAQMRKVWVSPAPKGERVKLAVIRDSERGDVHMLSLDVSTPELALEALTALNLAHDALGTLARMAATPVKAPAAPKAPRVPTPPAPQTREAIIAKARAERGALSVAPTPVTRNPAPKAPEKLSWFTELMAAEGAI